MIGLHRVEQIMGTAISVKLADALPRRMLDQLAEDAFAWFREVDQRFSTYREDSEIALLESGDLMPADCSPDVQRVLAECSALRDFTEGYFDAYATGRLDPSGYVKGWSVQVASDRLASAGATNHCINAGGDVRVRGNQAAGVAWRVGVRHPFQSGKVAWVLTGSDLAVATSGTYERGCHVVDPRSGTAARELCSVTVVGPDLGLADAYATAAMAMGLSGLRWLAALDGSYESAVVTADGVAYRSGGLPVASITNPASRRPAPRL